VDLSSTTQRAWHTQTAQQLASQDITATLRQSSADFQADRAGRSGCAGKRPRFFYNAGKTAARLRKAWQFKQTCQLEAILLEKP
jgi:hypothetical protein